MMPRIPVKYIGIGFAAAVSLFVVREDIVLPAYQDIVGVWTIGAGSTRYPDGSPVKPNDRITPKRAVVMLEHDVDAHRAGIVRCIGEDVPMYPHEIEALTALAHNVGVRAVCASSIPPKLRAGQYEAACKTIQDFNGVCEKREAGRCLKKRVIPWLVESRRREYEWCMGTGKAAP